MRWNRTEYIDLMTFHHPERPMFSELFGLLIGLDEEWKRDGATPEELALTGFCFDYVKKMFVGTTGPIHTFQETVIAEDEESYLGRDYLGRTVRMCKNTATIPLPMDYPVKDMDSWLKIKPMFVFEESRVDEDQIQKAIAAQKEGTLILCEIPGGFDMARELMGEENLCIAYYEDPELIEDIIGTLQDTAFQVLDRISSRLVIDNLFVHEDMAGKSGPLVGPNIVREFIAPYYRAVWDLVHSRGCKLFSQDSDGNMVPVMDAFIEAGVNVFYPCEPASGMDIVALRQKYGKTVAFKGGLDKHVLRRSKEEIRRELEYKMQPCMREGMVFALDHRIPNGTPLENYRYYVRTAREILGLEPLATAEPGWERTAF